MTLDWSGLLRAGVAAGLRPAEVWGLTPAELAVVTGRDTGAAPLARARLEELAAAFPDAKESDDG